MTPRLTLPTTPTPIPDAEDRRRPWVTTAGVVVGGAYIRPAPQLGSEALRLQMALLGWPRQQRIALKRSLIDRVRELLQ